MASGETSVSELAAPFEMSLPAVMNHLRVLERAGLLSHQKQGRVRRCRLDAAPLQAAERWIESYREFWDARMDSLADYLANESQEE